MKSVLSSVFSLGALLFFSFLQLPNVGTLSVHGRSKICCMSSRVFPFVSGRIHAKRTKPRQAIPVYR